MSSTTITIRRCDRCGHETEVRQQADRLGWSGIHAVEVQGEASPRKIGDYQEAFDLCPGCTDNLFAWWRNGDPVEQPAIAQSTPPAAKRFTIEDRALAIARATAVLREQVEQAFDAAREQPTSLLGGQILPGGLAGIDGRAFALVDAVIAQLDRSTS